LNRMKNNINYMLNKKDLLKMMMEVRKTEWLMSILDDKCLYSTEKSVLSQRNFPFTHLNKLIYQKLIRVRQFYCAISPESDISINPVSTQNLSLKSLNKFSVRKALISSLNFLLSSLLSIQIFILHRINRSFSQASGLRMTVSLTRIGKEAYE
jgi:hypothetical protein